MFSIRNAEIEDAKRIAEIKVDTWRSAYKGLIPEDYLNSLDYDEQARRFSSLISRDDKSFVLVAEADSQIIGFAAGGKERTNEYHYSGELYAIYVMNQYQKRGIGKSLVSQVTRRLTEMGVGSMLVWTLEKSPYRRFYESLRGEVIERMPFDLVDSDLFLVSYGWKNIDKELNFKS